MNVSYILPYLPVNTYRIEYLFTAYGKASRSLARLDGMLSEKSYANVLLSPMMTQEAVLSSRIEGTRSTIDEVYSLEAGEEFVFRHGGMPSFLFVDSARKQEDDFVRSYK